MTPKQTIPLARYVVRYFDRRIVVTFIDEARTQIYHPDSGDDLLIARPAGETAALQAAARRMWGPLVRAVDKWLDAEVDNEMESVGIDTWRLPICRWDLVRVFRVADGLGLAQALAAEARQRGGECDERDDGPGVSDGSAP